MPRPRASRSSSRLRGVAAAALLVHLISITGFPIPQLPAKDRSRPFACMYRRCGCMSADQCLGGCCCAKQKAAPARRTGPADPAGCCPDRTGQGDSKSPGAGVQLVITSQARQCRGLAPEWSVLSTALPPPAPAQWSFEWLLIGMADAERPLLSSAEIAVPVRPPSVAQAFC